MIKFPNETAAYREARDKLLAAELELSKQTEAVAALRRQLPLGGEVTTDYVFRDERGDVRLSDLFGHKDTLVLYSFMYGPKQQAPCPMCTSFLDGLDAQAPHITENVALAVTANAPISRIRDFTNTRPWNHLRLVSSKTNSYQRDYHGESAEGDQSPMLNVFVKRAGKVHHFWGTEMLYAEPIEGQDPRHIDTMWPLWNVLDLTPAGRGKSWHPKLSYD